MILQKDASDMLDPLPFLRVSGFGFQTYTHIEYIQILYMLVVNLH